VLLFAASHRFRLLLLASLALAIASAQDFQFDGKISKQALDNYLSRSITFVGLLQDDVKQPRNAKGVDPHDNIRFLVNTGAKFVGRAIKIWGNEQDLPAYLKNAKAMAAAVHQADPEIILQAGEFEIITPHVEKLTVPKSVLAEFQQPVIDRRFIYKDMLYPAGKAPHHAGTDKAVPDMGRVETRMWFYYMATSYIDAGVEAIHFGQIGLMDKDDPHHAGWLDLLGRVRAYARQHARRHFVLCDAHEGHGGIVENGRLLFDFHSKPLRIVEVPDQPFKGVLEVGYADSLYQRSVGGITPSGWSCDHLPYLVEFDNFGGMVHDPGKPSKAPFIWGWDEITWFALMPEKQRDDWLRYAWNWVKKNDPNGHLEMPGSRVVFPGKGIEGPQWFWAGTKSPACPYGFNTEQTIKDIWATDSLAGGQKAGSGSSPQR
jgi:hypothetical protein